MKGMLCPKIYDLFDVYLKETSDYEILRSNPTALCVPMACRCFSYLVPEYLFGYHEEVIHKERAGSEKV